MTSILFGIDRLLTDASLRAPLKGKRVALLAHPASVTQDLTHSLDALVACSDITVSAAFGPQHGLRGDKQDNMVESPITLIRCMAFPCSVYMAPCVNRPMLCWIRLMCS
jgi:uncharacterized protein YbbC (DUF1343 family)